MGIKVKKAASELKPGSYGAVLEGCNCPMLSNNFGEGAWFLEGKPMYDINKDCPIHGGKNE